MTAFINNFCFFVKAFKGGFSGLKKILGTESPLKKMKNAFYFTLKLLFILKIFKFDFLVMYKNALIRKKRLILRFMTAQPG